MNQNSDIPNGFILHHDGSLLPESRFSDEDLAKHDFVLGVCELAGEMSKSLGAFKKDMLGNADALIDLIREKYNAKIGGKKGNVTLQSLCGKYKVEVQVAESISFGPEITIAIEKFEDAVNSEDAPDLHAQIVSRAFRKSAGQFNVASLNDLLKIETDNQLWNEGQEALRNSMNKTFSKRYIRFYERNDEGEFRPIPMEFSKL